MAARDHIAIEVWKDIPEYEGYQTSNLGHIRSFLKRGRAASFRDNEWPLSDKAVTLQQSLSGKYLRVSLRHNSGKLRTRRVHQLVLAAFVGPRPPGMVACHKHEPRTDNSIGNLRWSTQKSNIRDAGHKGTKKVLSQEQIDELVRLASAGMIPTDLAIRFGVKRPCIYLALKREGFTDKRTWEVHTKVTRETLRRARRLRKEGMSYSRIAAELGVAAGTVHRWIENSSADFAAKYS